MTPEELLKPRYKVIAPWPGTHWEVGDIFEYGDHNCFKTESQPSIPMHVSVLDEHPHLFKKLEWWEDRKLEEMPEYVKSIMQEYTYGVKVGVVIMVKEWVRLCDAMYAIQSRKEEYHASCFVPATADEYNAYLQTLTVNDG